jgi:uncharacterized protein YcaQ
MRVREKIYSYLRFIKYFQPGYSAISIVVDLGKWFKAVNPLRFNMEISKDTARKFIVNKQGFGRKSNTVNYDALLKNLVKLGCLQLDTINVLERSHYLVVWSRVGSYGKELLDRLLFPDRSVFEYWAHAACMIPIEHYRYFLHTISEHRKEMKSRAEKWLGSKTSLLDDVLERIRKNGPMSSKDFADNRGERGKGWWDWKPAKIALELLFWAGFLMVDHREKFQRYYDLTENVLPSDSNLTEPTESERKIFYICRTLNSWGIARATEFKDYYTKWSTNTDMTAKGIEPIIKQLVKEGSITELQVADGKRPYYLLSKDIDESNGLNKEDVKQFGDVVFLSPFDNMTWCKPRIQRLFGFQPKLEAYVPKSKRIYGYYTLNILYRDKFVGRLDPKFHREKHMLEVKSLHLEDGFLPDEVFKEKLILAFQSLMKFIKAEKITFTGQCPKTLESLM